MSNNTLPYPCLPLSSSLQHSWKQQVSDSLSSLDLLLCVARERCETVAAENDRVVLQLLSQAGHIKQEGQTKRSGGHTPMHCAWKLRVTEGNSSIPCTSQRSVSYLFAKACHSLASNRTPPPLPTIVCIARSLHNQEGTKTG